MDTVNPKSLKGWMLANQKSVDAAPQMMKFFSTVARMLVGVQSLDYIGSAYVPDDRRANPKVTVGATHKSKSILLPVVRVEAFSGSLMVTLRDNFHDTAVSVCSEFPIEFDPMGIVDPSQDVVDPVFFEGFDPSWVYPLWNPDNNRRFSMRISTSHFDVYALLLQMRVNLARKLGFPDRDE